MNNLQLNKNEFKKNRNLIIDNFLNNNFALDCQKEVINSNKENFDRYSNPFEQKYTWRDKKNLPLNCSKLFNILNSKDFINKLNLLTGYDLMEDRTKNWWGIHTFENNDKLDIHVDAGRHPKNNLKKILTCGLYLSFNWKKENGGNLEFWSGDNSSLDNANIYKCIQSIEPKFNRFIIFENNDYSWHGAPEPCKCKDNEIRIFITCSYLTDINDSYFKNNRKKAFFVKRPNDEMNIEKDKLRLERSHPEKCINIYNINNY